MLLLFRRKEENPENSNMQHLTNFKIEEEENEEEEEKLKKMN